MKKSTNKFFTEKLLFWNSNVNTRKMPWKGIADPYKIWLSEIILQQTRVEQGTTYYNRFIAKFPTVEHLALSKDDEVFKMWEGLGYYSRCKNLIATAKIIAFEYNGIFPNNYNEILQLKGVGPYTAAAIASFAFNLPNAVVDGNVTRVIARFFGSEMPIDTTEGKKHYTNLAQTLLHKTDPGNYNQAIMDFGATVCKPQLPLCKTCILQNKCFAYANDLTKILPVKAKKILKRNRYFYYVIVEQNDKVFVRKRTHKDIWQNLWEFVLIETAEKLPVAEFIKNKIFRDLFAVPPLNTQYSSFYKQQLTHQTLEGLFLYVTTGKDFINDEYTAINKSDLKTLAFPRFITKFLETKQELKILEG